MKTLLKLKSVPCCPKRYEIAVLSFFGIALLYTLRVSLSLAIVAIARTDIKNITVDEKDSCPVPKEVRSIDGNMTTSDEEFYWSQKVVTQVLAAYHYGFISTQLLGGYVAERFGTKYVLGTSITVCALLNIISPLAIRTNFYFFFVIRILQGIFGGVALPAVHPLMSQWFPPGERAFLSSILFSAIFVGSLVAMGLSGVLITWSGWPLVYYFFGSITLVWSLLWMLLAFNSPSLHPRITPEERDYINRELGVIKQESSTPHKVPWLKILTSIPVWTHMLVQFGVTWLFNFFLLLIPQYSKHILHFDIQTNGFYSAVPYMANCVGCLLSGPLSQWLRHRQYISHLTAYRLFNGIAMLGPAVCMIAITMLGCNTTAIVVMLGLTMGLRGAYFGGGYLNHMDLAIRYTGSIAGISHTFSNLTGILVPIVAGWVFGEKQTLSQWKILFYVATAVLVIPYILFLIFGSVDEQPWNRQREAAVSSSAQQPQLVQFNNLPDDEAR